MSEHHIEPYLFFGGRCEEALDFYRTALGAEIQCVMHHDDSPEPPPPGVLAPGFEHKVMHSSFRIGDSVVMASDGCGNGAEGAFGGFSLSISLSSEADVDRAFAALSKGGTVTLAPTKTFWSPRFAMLKDRFGVGWMIGVHVEQPSAVA